MIDDFPKEPKGLTKRRPHMHRYICIQMCTNIIFVISPFVLVVVQMLLVLVIRRFRHTSRSSRSSTHHTQFNEWHALHTSDDLVLSDCRLRHSSPQWGWGIHFLVSWFRSFGGVWCVAFIRCRYIFNEFIICFFFCFLFNLIYCRISNSLTNVVMMSVGWL